MREMESLIKVNSGQIAVLGGLIEDSVNDIEDTVPIINSIPFIGSLFSSRNRNNTKTELVVSWRPIVRQGSEAIDGDFPLSARCFQARTSFRAPTPARQGCPSSQE